MGTHNPDLQRGLDSVFECYHLDWYPYQHNKSELQSIILGIKETFNPDIVFIHTQSGDVIDIQTLNVLSRNAIVFNWTGDVRHPLPQFYIDIGRHVTATLFTNMVDVELCNTLGIKADFLQVGFDSAYFNPLGKTDSKYPEIIFLGSNYPNVFPLSNLRYEMVHGLKNEFGSRFGVYGGGWGDLCNGYIDNYADEGIAYRSCKIAINLSHFAYSRYSSDRMFRILGSGAFCLTHNFPDLEKDFVPNKEVVVWNSIDDLKSKIYKYLINDKERENIALKGCLKARTNFTWHHFAKNLKLIIDNIKKEKYEYK